MEDKMQANHPVAVGARQAYAPAPAKKKNKKKEDAIPFDRWESYLSEIPALITAALEATTAAELDAAITKILTNVWQTKEWGEGATKAQLQAHMGRSRIPSVSSISDHSRRLAAVKKASFREKRQLMRSTLHLNVRELIFKNPDLIEVVRMREEPKAPSRKFLLDCTNKENVARKFGSDGISMDAIQVGGQGWLVIEAGQSCIVRDDCGEIEFIALRNAISTADLVEFIDLNANRAADNFRGLRPTEPGSITAFGLSAGPRHRRMFGYARNLLYPNRWTESELTRMHHDLLACASLVWMVAESRLPAAVLNQIESDFVKSGLPGIFTSQIEEGTGFCLQLNGKQYEFESAPRAPPEVYWSKNYASRAHKENTSTPYAISYTAQRTEMAGPGDELPPFGGDFVDIGLKVMMRQASDTLFVFRARQYHGTTPMHQVQQTGVVYPFSSRLEDAYAKATKAGTVELDQVYSAGDAPMVDKNI